MDQTSLQQDGTDAQPVGLGELRDRLTQHKVREQVDLASRYVLSDLQATTRDARKSSEQIWTRLKELELPFSGERSTFSTQLSSIAQDSSSPIASSGRGRGGGYYLSAVAKQIASEVAQPTPAVPSTTQGEKALYPVVREWLSAQGFQARVTAPMRALGKWSNPDITAIAVSEHLGRLDLEIATVEVKSSLAQWEYWFFEAVSHRRFANRAYFAFPLPEELAEKLPTQLRYMCELYHVGALVLILPDADYKALQEGTLADELTLENVSVQEVHSAPWNRVPLTYQREFCEAIEIDDLGDLFTWGST
jgi:hypothetical protein